LLRVPIHSELVVPTPLACGAQMPAQVFVRGKFTQCAGESARIARRHEHAGLAIAHDVADTGAADVARKRRQRGAHRFEQHQAKRLRALDRR